MVSLRSLKERTHDNAPLTVGKDRQNNGYDYTQSRSISGSKYPACRRCMGMVL